MTGSTTCQYGMTGVMKGWTGMTGSTTCQCYKSVWDGRCKNRMDWDATVSTVDL